MLESLVFGVSLEMSWLDRWPGRGISGHKLGTQYMSIFESYSFIYYLSVDFIQAWLSFDPASSSAGFWLRELERVNEALGSARNAQIKSHAYG